MTDHEHEPLAQAVQDHGDEIRKAYVESGQPHRDEAADEGPRWTTDQLQEDFEVLGFAAPFIVVRRKSDGVLGTLEFTHSPRVYFGFRPDCPGERGRES